MSNGGIPIKFGPEWLRNLGEGSSQGGNPRLNNQNGHGSSQTTGNGRERGHSRVWVPSRRHAPSSISSSSSATSSSGTSSSSNLWPSSSNRVHLANLRYGREEMLALYDTSVTPPDKLKTFESLYQVRHKSPSALKFFKDGLNSPSEGASGFQGAASFLGRGRGHGGRTFPKNPPIRTNFASNRTNYASSVRRQTRNTNWRQSGREEEDEWRPQEHGVWYPITDRDWTERSRQWTSYRRPWTEQQTDELPEWAIDNVDAAAGTFDASGAFHGSSDETVPQDSLFRPNTAATQHQLEASEGSAQWRASENFIESSQASKESVKSSNVFDSIGLNKNQNQLTKSELNVKVNNDVQNQYSESSSLQSVMLPQKYSLREKHQNIVAPNHSTSTSRPTFMMYDRPNTQQPNEVLGPEVEQVPEPILNDTSIPAINMLPNNNAVVATVSQPIPQMETISNSHIGVNNAFQRPGVPYNAHAANTAQNPIQLENSALGTPLNHQTNVVMMPIHNVVPQMNVNNPGMNIPPMQHSNPMGAYPKSSRGHGNYNMPPFLPQNINMQLPLNNNRQQPNHELPTGMFPMQGIQPPSLTQFNVFENPMRNQLISQTSPADLWYYEDPQNQIQGPFLTDEMYGWFKAGYFNPNMFVRRVCETTMRRLAEYGPSPFSDVEVSQVWSQPHPHPNPHPNPHPHPHPYPHQNLVWVEPAPNAEPNVNNLPMYFWDLEPSVIPTKTIKSEEIMKGMKTEDEILAQILGSQNIPESRVSVSEDPMTSVPKSGVNTINDYDIFAKVPLVPDVAQLSVIPSYSPPAIETQPTKKQPKMIISKKEIPVEAPAIDSAKLSQQTLKAENKLTKTNKNESDKNKNKDSNSKTKVKKSKDEKKEQTTESAASENATKMLVTRSAESSPSKASKDIKVLNKKEMEKEKKELMKDGFTIVKGPEKNNNKEIRKKAEEIKVAEEAARKRKEEEEMMHGVEESRRLLLAAAIKREVEQQQQKQASESVGKKAPWSAVTRQATTPIKDGLTLAEIQKLEREKKLEQIKEQQHMMHVLAQQQAVTLAREQEVQASLGWAKKLNTTPSTASLNIAEVQSNPTNDDIPMTNPKRPPLSSESTSEVSDEKMQSAPPISNHVLPWGHNSNGGFWDSPSQPIASDAVKNEGSKADHTKSKTKSAALASAAKKQNTPAMEFDAWCSQALILWSSKIDVPTFMGFLKDIESPYEVKDYVKCYLGESRDSSDFSRQFLERRSKLLRVGTVTPSDDLCSPAIAINPRNNSTSDYQEIKGKSKKIKKNKMMRVDARILGFSVTASEDRINVGDIDTA